MARQHDRQEHGQLQAVFLRGREQAERPVELEAIYVWAGRFHVADESMEFDESE